MISDEAIAQITDGYTVGNVIIIFFSIYMSNLSLSGLPEYVSSFSVSLVEMRKISNIVDRESRVVEGEEIAPNNITKIVFDNVLFQYENPLFSDFTLEIKRGTTAFIGSSGSGKTTIINLLLRFYDIFKGRIYFES